MKRVAAVFAVSMLIAGCDAQSPLTPSGSQSIPPSQGTFTLSGTVTSAGGVPVEGARVEAVAQVQCTDNPPNPYPGDSEPTPCMYDQMFGSDDTDASGAFSLANLPSAYFTINVSKDGALVSGGVYVQADSTVEFTLPENPSAVVRTTQSRRVRP
jgi:hypothetical protein